MSELESLFDAHLRNELDAEGRRRLAALLQEDAEAGAACVEYALETAMMVRSGAHMLEAEAARPRGVRPPVFDADALRGPAAWFGSRRSLHAFAASVVLAATVIFSMLVYMQRLWNAPRPTGAPTAQSVVARVHRTASAVWKDGADRGSGAPLRAETIELRSGLAEIRFRDGAVVLLEGPARFEPRSGNGAKLWGGRLYARVPESAKGFRVDTEAAAVVDLGTAFGLRVDPRRRTEVHVFEGAVAVAAASNPGARHGVKAGQGARVAVGSDRVEFRAADAAQFLNDPRGVAADALIGRWDLNEGFGRRVGVAAHAEGAAWHRDAVRGWVLDFDGDDMVEVRDVDLTGGSFTISAWVRPASQKIHRSYFFGQGTRDPGLGLHFGFYDAQTVRFSFMKYDLDGRVTMDDQWHHWAATFDASTLERAIYRDGIEVARDKAPRAYGGAGPLWLGASNISSKSKALHPNFGAKGPVSHPFAGRLSGVAVFDRALTPREVARLAGSMRDGGR